MDLHCPKCYEPWDRDTLHDTVSERWPEKPWLLDARPTGDAASGSDFYYKDSQKWYSQTEYEKYFKQVRTEFYRDGCVALGGSKKWCDEAAVDNKTAYIASAVYEMFGDDVDAAADSFQDTEQMGWMN